MKHIKSVIMVIGLLMVSACGGSDDPISLWNEVLDTMEQLAIDAEGSDSADALVASVKNYTSKMEGIIPRMKPFLNYKPDRFLEKELHKKFKEIERRFNKLVAKMNNVGRKLDKYSRRNPEAKMAAKSFERTQMELFFK